MKYVLDTNACIRILKGDSPSMLRSIANISSENIIIPSIVRFELYYGAYKSSRPEETLRKLKYFLTAFEHADLNSHIGEIAGRVRADLERKGMPVGPYDLLIGATALSLNAVLITHNKKEFSRIPDLVIEDWET